MGLLVSNLGSSGWGAITLTYRHKRYGQEWEDVRQDVPLDWTPCHFGGERPWFICGNCGRRVAVIYGAGKYFACRHCYDLTYRSCQESDKRINWLVTNPEVLKAAVEGDILKYGLLALKAFDRIDKIMEREQKRWQRKRRGRPRKLELED
jgi:hypothetical protein